MPFQSDFIFSKLWVKKGFSIIQIEMEKCKIDDSVRRRSLLLPWSKVIQIVTRPTLQCNYVQGVHQLRNF